MTAREQRRLSEPGWCTGEHTNGPRLPLHRSPAVRVGPEPVHTGRGQVSAWLAAGGNGPTSVAFQTAHMTSVTVETSLEHAKQFHAELGELIARAERG